MGKQHGLSPCDKPNIVHSTGAVQRLQDDSRPTLSLELSCAHGSIVRTKKKETAGETLDFWGVSDILEH